MHSSPKSFEVEGVALSPALVEKLSGKPAPALSDAYPSGMSDEYGLESISQGTVVLQATDPSVTVSRSRCIASHNSPPAGRGLHPTSADDRRCHLCQLRRVKTSLLLNVSEATRSV
ncbi:hypothetical protein D3C77_513800 [compost metagenome]